ncbi:MAG: replication initiator protein [Microviridae sp.]|nr:MAG: replication initiator protein [Microviridae sp.]
MHEAKMHDDNCFITLTYDEQNVPSDGSLRPRDYVLFMKKLRKKYGPVRFFHCGEYGDVGERPHHHALLFGFDFDDKSKLPRTNEKYKLYRSAELDRLWGLGFCTIGECNFESAGYVARYAMKKVGGKIDYKGRCPEYLTMSRRPGIGRAWFEKFRRDVYPFDEVIVDGVRSKPPRYYDNVLEKMEPKQLLRLKSKRRAKALHDIDGTGPRLIVREAVRAGAIRTLKRSLEV